MLIYCICTQYLVGAPFALITASIRRGMEVISLWHCWGGVEAQVSLTVAFSSSAFFGLLFLIFLLTTPQRFSMGFRSGEFAGQSSTSTPWSYQLLVLLAVWTGVQILLENEISIFKKLVSRRKHEVHQNFLVNWVQWLLVFKKHKWTNTSRWHCTPNHHRLWKLNTGLQATWAMSFSTLPPDSRTLVSKWNTKLALIWKEDFGPLGNSPVLLLLSPKNCSIFDIIFRCRILHMDPRTSLSWRMYIMYTYL